MNKFRGQTDRPEVLEKEHNIFISQACIIYEQIGIKMENAGKLLFLSSYGLNELLNCFCPFLATNIYFIVPKENTYKK
jgi:hypothetical protein